jgi:hypothetical protein
MRATGFVRLGALLFLLMLIGCTGEAQTGTVSGIVKFGGQPLTQGLVTFVGPNGQSGSARIQADGRYAVTNAPLGDNKIAVSMPPPEGTANPSALKNGPAGEAQQFQLPEHFADPNRSGLSVNVKKGMQIHHIELQ